MKTTEFKTLAGVEEHDKAPALREVPHDRHGLVSIGGDAGRPKLKPVHADDGHEDGAGVHVVAEHYNPNAGYNAQWPAARGEEVNLRRQRDH